MSVKNINNIIIVFLKSRLRQQYSNISKRLPYFRNYNPTMLFFVLKFIDLVFMLVATSILFFNFYNPKFKEYWGITFIIIFLIMHIFNGILSYKKTHIPKLINLIKISPCSSMNFYIILLLEELLWFMLNNLSLYLVTAIFFIYISNYNIFIWFISYSLLLLVSVALFILSNRLAGSYVRNKIINPIGLVRFIIYTVNVSICFLIGYGLIKLFAPPIIIIKKNINSLENLLNDSSWNLTLSIIENKWFNKILVILEKVFSNELYLQNYLFQQFERFHFVNLFFILLSIIFIIILITLPIRFITIDSDSYQTSFFHKDILYYYSKLLEKFSKKWNNDFLLVKEIHNLHRNRWLVSPTAFSLMFVTFESSFYFGITFSLLDITSNLEIKTIILFTLNLLILINHSFELRDEFPNLFLLSAEKHNVNLYKLSIDSSKAIFIAKLKLMYLILLIPFCLVVSFNFFYFFSLDLEKTVFIIISIISCYILSPILQMYSVPLLAKFDHVNITDVGKTKEEDILYTNAQSLPRKFIVLPLLIIPYLGIFVNISAFFNGWLVPIYFIYFHTTSIIFLVIAQRIIKRGIQRIDDTLY